MRLYDLPLGGRFRLKCPPRIPPGGPMPEDLGVLIAGRIDGVYRQVRAEDPEIHRLSCEAYDSGASFFVLYAGSEVWPA